MKIPVFLCHSIVFWRAKIKWGRVTKGGGLPRNRVYLVERALAAMFLGVTVAKVGTSVLSLSAWESPAALFMDSCSRTFRRTSLGLGALSV